LIVFKSTFSGVSWQEEFKNPIISFAKSPCRKLFPKKSIKKSMSVVPRPVLFYHLSRLRVFFSNGSSKTPQKTFYKNKTGVKKLSQKNWPQIRNQFFLKLVLPRFLVFGVSRWGVQKHRKKYKKITPDPGPSLAAP
jgi:hypothetical protein